MVPILDMDSSRRPGAQTGLLAQHDLVIAITDQLNGRRRAFSGAGTATLAFRGIDPGSAKNPAIAGRRRLNLRNAERADPYTGETTNAFRLVYLRNRASEIKRMLRKDRDRSSSRGKRVSDGLFDELWIVRHPGDKDAFFHEIHWAHL